LKNKQKEFFYTDFNSLGNIVNSVVQETNLRQGMKKATIFKFWQNVVGKKFEKHSRIEALTQQGILIVACSSAAVSSELTMFKTDILKKINTYSKPLDIPIVDINFSHKIWKNQQSEQTDIQEAPNPYKKDLSNFNPESINLDPNEINAIKNSVMNNKFATEEQREKMFNAIILDLKIQKYIEQKSKTSNP